MSRSAHDSRGREPRRKKKAVDEDEEAAGEAFTQPRASHQSKKPAPNGKIVINGNVHISNVEGNLTLFQELKDDPRSQPASNPIRASSRQLQPARNKRLTVQRDSPSASEEDLPSESDDTDPEYVAPKRPARSMNPPDQLRLHSEKKRRHQLDEGYHSNHTSGTVSYTAQINSKQFMKGKGKERSASSVDSSSSRPRLSSSAESRKSKERQNETDATSGHSDVENCDEESAEEDDRTENNAYLEDEEASDDDFLKLAICIARPNDLNGQGIFENAILDTGTKADWISQRFYDDLRHTGVRTMKLDPEDSEMKYRDFQGKAFKPTGKVDLMIQTEEFKGHIKCRMMKFLVASKATFKIIFGRDTIREHGFYERRKCDTDGEGVLIGVHDELTEAQKAEIKRKKEEKNKIAQERKKMRDAKTEKSVRHKENAATPSSSKVAAHFATSVSRSSKTRSPSKSTKESPRHSSSSMDGTW